MNDSNFHARIRPLRCLRKHLVLISLLASFLLPALSLPVDSRPSGFRAVAPRRTTDSTGSTILTFVRQVRDLKPDQAARLVPLRLTGVVTALSGWKNSFFFQDQTSGISVDRTDSANVQMGDRVEITGTSGPGLFAPVVLASKVVILGHSAPPVARRVTYSDLFGGAQDSQWVEIDAIIHSAHINQIDGHWVLVLSLQSDGGPIKGLLHDYPGMDYKSLVDAKVRLRGVCASDFNQKRQFVGLEIYIPKREYLEVLEPARQDPFSANTTPVGNVLQFGQAQHRVKVTGVSTYQIAGHALYLQDGDDGIRVQSTSTQWVGPGRRVEAVGFPVIGEYAPILQDSYFRDLGPAAPVTPVLIEAGDVVAHREGFDQVPYDQQLVRVRGRVAESHITGGQLVWILREGNEVFEAYLPISSTDDRAHSIGIGSVLTLTGICVIHTDSEHIPISFGILLRSPQDVEIVSRASWWTTIHSLIVLAAAFGLMSLVMLWVVVLRKRVEQQTRIIRASEGRFRDLAQQDVLTGLPNRLLLEERIAQTLKQCDAHAMRAVVLTIDVDRFKQINDNYGHPVGDECLKIVAARLRSLVRQADTIARTGGEEFTIVVGGLSNPESAGRISSAILDLFHDPVMLPGHEIKLTVSIGGALYPDDGTDSEMLRKRSDQALYEAKRAGRNRAVFASEELCVSLELATTIESALREGLRSNSFKLHYQPIYDQNRLIQRFEALLRTSDRRLSEIGPAAFIPIAETTGLIVPLGRWVLEEACRQIAAWKSQCVFDCPVAVNLSARQLSTPGFAGEFLGTLFRNQIDPQMVELELTETTAMTELAIISETVTELANAGVSLAIDDFGTGYSSLSRLHDLPIKTVKIDRSFVKDLERGGGFYTIILAIIQMAQSLNLDVVAEGVETDRQFHLLRELGCDFFQGFLFNRPLRADQVLETLAANRAQLPIEPTLH